MQVPLVGKVHRPLPWILGLMIVGLLSTGAVSYLIIRGRSTATDISSLTLPVASQALTVRITASGTIQPTRTVNLSPRTTGDILSELYVEQGDRVTKGQILARMKSDSIEAELLQSQARVEQAQAQLAELRAGNRPEDIAQSQARMEQAQARVTEARARLALANERIQRNRMLQTEGALSRDELDAAIMESDSANANLEQSHASLREAEENYELQQRGSRIEEINLAEARLAEAIGNLRAAEVRKKDTLIRAPFSGVIMQRFATEGAFVTPTTSASTVSSATSSAIVAIAEGLEVNAEVPEVDLGHIKPDQTVEIVADAFPDQVFRGRVKRIAPEAVERADQRNFRYFEVTVEVLTGQDQLRSGMSVDATFIGDEVDDALVVPTVAIVTIDGQTGVLIPDNKNRPRFQPITLGSTVGNQTQILDGVEASDPIFIDLPPGQNLENLNFGRKEKQ
ncbi:MAG: HlyD family efflux transporter periplasmic adaptor subunit [Cyanothece sp. SIO1E1]|nr:HlyD family efflux transporter periplasmic adaptor subunit [Cyanothece sp. SIO1E1]